MRSETFHNYFINKHEDGGVSNRTRQQYPALKSYYGIPLTIDTHIDIKKGRAKGTLCRGTSIKWKINKLQKWKD